MKNRVRIILILAVVLTVVICKQRQTTISNEENTTRNGDLNSSFAKKDSSKLLSAEQQHLRQKEKLISEGWKEEEIQNGQLPDCYNFKPKKGKIENFLEVFIGSGTDVSIKVMDVKTDKCVRYFFVNSRNTYTATNIPESKYYLKIAYGKNWLSKIENNQCIGKFIKNPIYEKGKDILDFTRQKTENGYNIPSFSLKLDIISSAPNNSFNSLGISEDEFNK